MKPLGPQAGSPRCMRGKAIKACWWRGVRANSNRRNTFSAKQNLSHKNSGLLSHDQAETNCQLIQKFLRKVFCLQFDSFRCYQLRKDWTQVNYLVQIPDKTSLYWYAVHEASWPLQSCCYRLTRSGSRIFRIDLHILETEARGQHQRGAALPLREQEEPCWALQPAGKFHINNAEYPQLYSFLHHLCQSTKLISATDTSLSLPSFICSVLCSRADEKNVTVLTSAQAGVITAQLFHFSFKG